MAANVDDEFQADKIRVILDEKCLKNLHTIAPYILELSRRMLRGMKTLLGFTKPKYSSVLLTWYHSK